jgi:putative hydrolase of the HAD superfamily
MARYVLFDIDDTLFPSTEFSSLARRNAINAMISMGLDRDYEYLSAKLKAIIDKMGSNYPNHFDDLCREAGIREPGRYIAAAVAAYHDTKTSIAPFPRVPMALLKLKEAGLRLYVATQGSSIKQWDKLIRLRLALFFDGAFVSEELGCDKGDAFYRKVLEALGAAPGDCVMVGDREDSDIIPAAAAGMKTVRVRSARNSGTSTRALSEISDVSELPGLLQRL